MQAIAPYRARDPTTTEEEEFLENMFDVVCACLMLPDNKPAFVEAEGGWVGGWVGGGWGWGGYE